MLSPRWKKVLRDLWSGRGRMALMVAALAISLFALGSTLSAFGILSRELTQAYLGTRPAAATLESDRITPDLIEQVRHLPGVSTAEARATIRARVKAGDEWRTLLLFVVPDFEHMQLSTFDRMEGAWPPPAGTMLVEHMALPLLPGRTLHVKTLHGEPKELAVSGVVWDSSLAPAAMEQTVWGYITPETLAYLGETGGLDEVKLAVAGPDIENTAKGVAAWLQGRGHAVREIQIPPPYQHPHQGQMRAIMLMFNVFAVFALLLSGVLVGNAVAALMARQVREIGILKTLGAGRGPIVRLYLAMMLVLGAAAWTLAFPPTLLAAKALAGTAAGNLNLRIASTAIPWWALAAQVLAALLVPVLAAAWPVLKASGIPVQQALHDTGTQPEAFGSRRLDGWLGRLRELNPLALLGLRNTFRKRGRLLLSMGLLAGGGAMFMTGLNFSKAWNLRLAEIQVARKYDATLRLQRPEPREQILAAARSASGVSTVEAWGTATASWSEDGGVPVVRTYPDKGHGSFQVTGIPPASSLVDFPVLAGRWLQEGDDDVVVLNHVAAASASGVRVGGTVTIAVEGVPHTWRVVGLVRELGSPATAYVPLSTFARITGTYGQAQILALKTSAANASERNDILRRAETVLQGAGFGIDLTLPVAMVRTAMSEHMAVLLGLILGLSGLMTIVGTLGLAATLSINVLERTRELGIMRTVGATPTKVIAVILGEGLVAGALSTLPALLLALPLTAIVNRVVGSLGFRMPLPFVVSTWAFLAWVGIVLVVSIAGSLAPAVRASRLSIREALAYV